MRFFEVRYDFISIISVGWIYCILLCVCRLKNVNYSILRKAKRLSRHKIFLCHDIIPLCCDIGSLCRDKEWISLFEVT